MTFYANLHTHSTHSDGKYTPEELALVAKAEGYKALAITDHDTATAFPHLKAACEQRGIDCIFGVEFTCSAPMINGYFHMVAFDFDPDYPEMKEYLRTLSASESEQTKYCFEKGKREGGLVEPSWEGGLSNITWDEVLEFNKDITWLCNEHVFRAMKAKGIVTDLDYPSFFSAYYGPRRSEYKSPYKFLTADKLIDLVHRAGGIILVAHPVNQLHQIDALLELGLDGLEAYHPDLPADQQLAAYKLGLEKGIFISGGSDHSGFCGGLYASFKNPKECSHYIDPLSCGTYELHFKEIKERRIDKEARAKILASLK